MTTNVFGKVFVKAFASDGKTISKASRGFFDRNAEEHGFTITTRNGIATKKESSLEEAKAFIDKVYGLAYILVDDGETLHHWVSVSKSITVMELRASGNENANELFELYSRFRNIENVCSFGGQANLFKRGKVQSLTGESTEKAKPVRKAQKKDVKSKPRTYDALGRKGIHKVNYEEEDEFFRGTAHFNREGLRKPVEIEYVSQEEVNGGHDKAETDGVKSWSLLQFSENFTIKHLLVVVNDGTRVSKHHIIGMNESQRVGLYSRLLNQGASFERQMMIITNFVNAVY